jgi:RimJ/RimL family protein N-acetyltransferase
VIERTFDVAFVNAVVNDPEVESWVRGPFRGQLDLSPIIADKRNVVLVGEHGFAVFAYRFPGVYEWHAAVRSEGRGWWALAAGRAALDWLFEHTDAIAVLAPIPETNRPARHIAAALGFDLKQILPAAWSTSAVPVELCVYTLLRRDYVLCQ